MIKDIYFREYRNPNHLIIKYISISIITGIILLSSLVSNAFSKNLTFQWNQDDNADYYVVYWGTNSGVYTMNSDNIDVQDTEYTATGLSDSGTYYFTVKAFNSCGNSSDFSDEIVCTEADGTVTKDEGDHTDSVSEDDVINISLTPELQAEISSSTVQTRWQISLSPDFSTIELDIVKANDLSFLKVPRLILNGGTTYYWRVSIDNTKGETTGWTTIKSFSTTVAVAVDDDGNGIPDAQEIDSSTDIDSNGVADLEQDDIKCVRNINNSQIIGVKKGLNVNDIELAEFIDHRDIDDTTGMPDEIPSGLIGFKIIVDNPGDNAQVIVYFSEPAADNAGWYKYDSINGWINYTSNVFFSSDRMSVTIDLIDGGLGDADGTANGVIVDPGGLGIMSTTENSVLSAASGEGGCFIITSDNFMDSFSGNTLNVFVLRLIVCLSVLLISRHFYRVEN